MNSATTLEEQIRTDKPQEPSDSVGSGFGAIIAAVFVGSFSLILYLNRHFRFDLSDDAYIHMRIAHNLLHTGHPYFNPGERVMVTSSPVWTLLLTLNELLFGMRSTLWVWNAIFVGVAAAAGCWLAWAWVESRGPTDKILGLLLPLTVVAALAKSSFLGMETPLAIALLLLAAVAFVRSSAWALPLLALGAFTRYELAVVLAVAGLVCLGTRTAVKHGAIPAAVIVSAFTIWLCREFGTIFPNAIKAKSKGYVIPASDILKTIRPPRLLPVTFENVLVSMVLVMIVCWAIEPVLDPRRRECLRVAALALALWGWTLAGIYLWERAYVFEWYQPLVWVPALVGILLMILIDHSKPRRMVALVLFAGLYASLYVLLASWAQSAVSRGPKGVPVFAESGRVHEYLAVGAALYQVCPQSQLMTSEIGALGYSFQGYISDGFGVASPEAIKYHPMRVPQERLNGYVGAIPPGFVRERTPDLIVTYDIFGQAVLAAPDIQADYDDLRFDPVLPSEASAGVPPVWGARTFHVLVKKGGSCPVLKVDDDLSRILTPQSEPAGTQ